MFMALILIIAVHAIIHVIMLMPVLVVRVVRAGIHVIMIILIKDGAANMHQHQPVRLAIQASIASNAQMDIHIAEPAVDIHCA